jgi:hypothetical protein
MCSLYVYAAVSKGKRKTEAQTIFFNPFTVCSSCKLKFVACPFVYEETNGSYPFANGLHGLAHLCNVNTTSPSPKTFVDLLHFFSGISTEATQYL